MSFEDIYKEFEYDYLHTSITVRELRVKYLLSYSKYNQLVQIVKKNNNITKRPAINKKEYGKIQKKINGKTVYYGNIPESMKELYPIALELCEKIGWENINQCKEAISKLKSQDKYLIHVKEYMMPELILINSGEDPKK